MFSNGTVGLKYHDFIPIPEVAKNIWRIFWHLECGGQRGCSSFYNV
jgi:hypothetical protein